MDQVVDQRRNQLQLLSWQLQLLEIQTVQNVAILHVIRGSGKAAKSAKRKKAVWIRPWLERRVVLGQIYTSHGRATY